MAATYGVLMARTAHHPSRGRRRFRADMLKGQPWHAVVLHDLRYSTRDVSEAVREGRRPRPHPVRRAVEVYAFPRHQGDGSVAREAAVEERRARQRLRRRAGTLLRLVDSPGGVIDLDAADLVDIPPARHRRGGLWLA
ncbi:hypothetical protein [Streptomyces sp. NRRL B-24572]|uniref:hypothetical protein n=1 Tax=Streptomyces sp. NRRL B-24572 TaxID=1962156 RepID=UPI00211AAC57|nr:hypothetical protein [Streptomyces sp. NRRL B-24572]